MLMEFGSIASDDDGGGGSGEFGGGLICRYVRHPTTGSRAMRR